MHSCFSEKYGKFVGLCRKYMRIVVMVKAVHMEIIGS